MKKINNNLWLLFACFLLGATFKSHATPYRPWTDQEGRVIEARLLNHQNNQITVERSDGQTFTFSTHILSEEDQAYLKAWKPAGELLKEDRTEVYDLQNPLLQDPLQVENRRDTGMNLVRYASVLGRSRELVVVKERGLYIQGTTLSGSGVQRPEVYLRRAAELLAEEALATHNARLMERSPGLFISRLRDPNSPIGFLRRGALENRETAAEFSIYCEVELANCYRLQGDYVSAYSILEKYRDRKPENEMLGRALATYAQALLEHGYHEEALRIARDVRDNCPIAGLQYGRSAQDIAIGVIAMMPTIDKDGRAPASRRELQLLANIESNPRRYLLLGDDAFRFQNFTSAIEYWQQFQEHFPTDEASPPLSIKIAQAWQALEDPERAIKAYEKTWQLYPDHKEAWQARLGIAEVHVGRGELQEALAVLAEGEKWIRSREGRAHLVAARANHLFDANQADEAAQCFIQLLSEYGDQDAAAGVWQKLSTPRNVRSIRDWRRFTKAIEDWLAKGSGQASLGGVELSVTAVSDLRRLALTVFIQNDRFSQGVNWLRRVGHASDVRHRQAIIRDEAWYYAEAARLFSVRTRNRTLYSRMTARDLDEAIDHGLRAWQLTDVFVEGFTGLEAAFQIALLDKASDRKRRQVRESIEPLLGTVQDTKARDMLARIYAVQGDTKALTELQQ